jgi:hypothetical protein
MPLGKCCCWCEYEDCPRICVGNNPCTTRLVISGNHPADLIYPISYSSDLGGLGPFPPGCGLFGEADVSREVSSGHTQLKTWTAGIRYWDSVNRTHYTCCGFDPQYEVVFNTESGSGVHVTGTCSRADLRYGSLSVLLRRDRIIVYGEPQCVVRADVCLRIKRLVYTNYKTCKYDTITKTYNSLPADCGLMGLYPPGTYNGVCSYCYDSSTGLSSSYANPGDISQAPYSYPSCTALTDAQWGTDPNVEEFWLCRRKYFTLSSIVCGPVSLMLGPEDNQASGPPILMYEQDPEPQTVQCGPGSFEDCPRNVPRTTVYGTWNSVFQPIGSITHTPPSCSLSPPTGLGLRISCGPRFSESSRNQGWARTGGWTGDPKLLAEVEDTWTLHLDCSHLGA